MTRKLAISLLFFVLGLATVDTFLAHEDWTQGASFAQRDDELVSTMQDGTGMPPRP